MNNKNLFLKTKYFLKSRYIYVKGRLNNSKIVDYKSIPIIINNFNRLTSLKALIASLEKRGYKNLFIIDNASTYPPLLEYYTTCPYKVFRLDTNVGYLALWKTSIYKEFISDFYVYTDSDVVPCDECPDDFLNYFWDILKRHKYATKVGFGLKIDDLPDHFNLKQSVVEWESKFWNFEVEKDLFRAPIDTTFALYKPFARKNANWYIEQYRTGGNYQARHIPWYNDTTNLSVEELYYINSCAKKTHWTNMNAIADSLFLIPVQKAV